MTYSSAPNQPSPSRVVVVRRAWRGLRSGLSSLVL